MIEIERKNITEEFNKTGIYKTNCIICKKEIILYFNGGELDFSDCCGYRYTLDTPIYDFVILNI